MAIKSSGIEQEVIILKAAKELIDSMVNFELMSLEGNDPDSTIAFKSITHQRLFNIIVVDFLSCTDKKGPIEQTSYLGGLSKIVNTPYFDENNSVHNLKVATQEFKDWIEQEVEVDVWLPSIDKKTKLHISRFDFLKMTGNISKHNYLRAIGVAKELKEILSKSGITVDMNEALLTLTDFYERFHTDILNYHSSTIAEFLNNIRWGIYDYLQPEFNKSIVWEGGDLPKYHYIYPKGIKSKFAKACYWELMNEVLREPYMRKFKVTKWLKLRY
ncbi:MAG: hypothetical protein PHQ86_07395 [Dehalococcoidales bacterium]|nr:hypothetical protein [Dehalococcoidales bacterium]